MPIIRRIDLRNIKDTTWMKSKKENWQKNAKHIMFSAYFQNQLNLSGKDFVDVIFDNFSDIDIP